MSFSIRVVERSKDDVEALIVWMPFVATVFVVGVVSVVIVLVLETILATVLGP
jgi:hypothetical protein